MTTALRTSALLALTCGTVFSLAGNAFAAPIDANFDCRAKTPVGDKTLEQKLTFDVTAPETVAPKTNFDIAATAQKFDVPSKVAGFDLKHIDNFALTLPVPPNSTYVDTTLEGGSGFGADPKISLNADKTLATVTLPGPIKAGTTVVPPKITVHLTSGASGTITATLYGTSYDKPGLTFDATAGSIVGDQKAPVACYPKPNPTLSTTKIG